MSTSARVSVQASTKSCRPSSLIPLAAIAVSALIAGCTARSAPMVGADPSDPNVKTPPIGYSSTLGPYTSRRPVGPGSWREQNERVAPQSEK